MDIVDRDKELLVRAELPSVENDDVEVTTTGDRLMIEAEREFEEEDEKITLPKIRVAERRTVKVA